MDLFILNDDKMPTIHPATLTIECFRTMWKRVRPIDGDHDGRKKLHNTKELGYIYFTGKYDSRFKLMTEEEKEKKVRELVALPEDWKPDQVIKDCIAVWEDSQVTASSELVLSLEGSVSSIAKYMKEANKSLATGNLNSVDPGTVKEIIQIIKDSPNLIGEIGKAKAALLKEQDALAKGRKGRAINKFELT